MRASNTPTGRSSGTLHGNEMGWKCCVSFTGSCRRFHSEEFYLRYSSVINFYTNRDCNTFYTSCCLSTGPNRTEGRCSFPMVSDHRNLGNTHPASTQTTGGKWSVILTILNECHLHSKPVEVANYLKPLAMAKDWQKINYISAECLINNNMHRSAQVSIYPYSLTFLLVRICLHNCNLTFLG